MHRIYSAVFCIAVAIVLLPTPALANGVAVTNVTLQNVDTDANTVEITFDLSQSNAFGDLTWDGQAFSDYLWIAVKYTDDIGGVETVGFEHATLAAGGTITPVADNKGAFVKASTATTDMTVVWNYGTDGVGDDAIVQVKVLAMETVKVPEGKFTYNAAGIGDSTYNNYGGGSETDVTSASDLPSGAAAGWPNGYSSFYIAKYEVSQGQYADFLNMLSAADAVTRFPNSNGSNGHTISYTAANAYGSRYAASVPNRACNFLSWDDAEAYAAWLALRPMTEMEFEKAARGSSVGGANARTYPWGDADVGTDTYTYNDGSGNATYRKYYAVFNNQPARPADVGHYLRGDIARTNEQTGASPYGVTDLAGNDWEHLINCAWTQVPANGAGSLSVPASWPGASAGKGLRGGSWDYVASPLRVSDRSYAGLTNATRDYALGFRPARTD